MARRKRRRNPAPVCRCGGWNPQLVKSYADYLVVRCAACGLLHRVYSHAAQAALERTAPWRRGVPVREAL